MGERAKLHLYLQPLPNARTTAWAPPPVRSAAAFGSHRSTNPTVNCACEGSRLRAPYKNLMPDDPRWSFGCHCHPQMVPSSCRKISSGLPLILHYGELYNYFIIYYNVIIIEIKCTINVMCLNHPETIPPPRSWKSCLPRNGSLVPKRLGTTDLKQLWFWLRTHHKLTVAKFRPDQAGLIYFVLTSCMTPYSLYLFNIFLL